jgi:hypothetical protein
MKRLAAPLLAVGILIGCAAPRGAFVISRDVCVTVLPTANAVVGSHSHLVFIQHVTHDQLLDVFPNLREPPRSRHLLHRLFPKPPTVCLVGYRGPFSAGQIPGTVAGGEYAVMAVSTRHIRVFAVKVTNTPPAKLIHH